MSLPPLPLLLAMIIYGIFGMVARERGSTDMYIDILEMRKRDD